MGGALKSSDANMQLSKIHKFVFYFYATYNKNVLDLYLESMDEVTKRRLS